MKKLIQLFSIFVVLFFTNGTIVAQITSADSLLNFIQQNKSRSSLYLIKNDSVIAHLNENKMMPLASTAKIIIAIEFAKQASHNLFDENKLIPLSELNKYYIPNTDGNAHPNWINYERQKGNIFNDSISLIEVAKGMILFSSNANAEYLMDFLGLNNINGDYKILGISTFTPLYYWVSALFLYQNPKHVKQEKILKEIKKFNNAQYASVTFLIHNQLKNDSTYKQKFRPQDLTLNMQKEWSDRLPASTTKEYVQICSFLNNRQIFNKKTYTILSQVLETAMENPVNQSWLSHLGMKGGSTIFVLTKALYATLKKGTKIEMAYFFNNLTRQENEQLQKWMNSFELKVLTDENFREKVGEYLN
ncbi:MAG TPA: serine hydrolase [Hanamia sp.]|nr:serine hydrolase [Hanamia sp.]